jgi:hypothetical protein
MTAIYRISNNSNARHRICSKEESLSNFLSVFKCNVIVVADGCDKALLELIRTYNVTLLEINEKSNGKSFLYCLYLALRMDKEEIVLFQEDDYLYVNDSEKILKEGIAIADYVTLYDHPDKYLNKNQSTILLSESCHWRTIPSTTMTFACKVKTILEDKEIIKRHIVGDVCLDHDMFSELTRTKTLVSPMPSYSTHTESIVLTPFRRYDNNVYC